MTKTTNKYSPEVRERAVRMVLDGAGQHESRWSAIMSISSKIGCAPQTLNEWVKKVEVDTGQRGGVTTEQAEKMKWRAPIRWSGLNVSASWASGLSGQCFLALAADIPMRCAA